MIFGNGIDLVNKNRIKLLYQKFGDRLLNKILTQAEIIVFCTISSKDHQVGYLAKRFAAKEALAKALGFGIGKFISFKDITVFNDQLGAPKIKLSEYLNHFLIKKFINNFKFHLSLSDEKDFAIASVIIEIDG